MCVKVDGVALLPNLLVVQVREASALAAVEDSAAANGQRAIGADGETTSENGVGLGSWGVELELVVGDDPSLTGVLVDQDTALQCCHWGVGTFLCSLPILERAFGGGAGIDRADLESTREVFRASRWSLG